MTTEQMKATILLYSIELRDEYNEMVGAFGHTDPAAQRLQTKYATVLVLIEKLGLDENYWFYPGLSSLNTLFSRNVFILLFMNYELDYIRKGYLNVWWASEDGGIIYTAEFRCYFVEEGIYEALLVDSYQRGKNYIIFTPLTSRELEETTQLVEEWAYNNPECI